MKPPRLWPLPRAGSRRPSREEANRALVAAAFDEAYYLAQNPDVAGAGHDALRHFMSHGWTEGRDPSPDFSVRDYLAMNGDVVATGENPFIHFLRHGRAEGRPGRRSADPTPHAAELRALVASAFDADHYRTAYPDVAETGTDLLDHFITKGWREGRDPRPDFSVNAYVAAHPVVSHTGLNPLVHYKLFGGGAEPIAVRASAAPTLAEQRALIASRFEPAWYLARNPDLGEVDAALHFLTTGWREGRDPTPGFSVAAYLARHPEVRLTGLNPLVHHVLARMAAGRAKAGPVDLGDAKQVRALVAPEFDAAYYRAHNRDLGEGADPLAHYLRRGSRKGRKPAEWFSPEAYRIDNPDLPAAVEPFAHYIAVGRAEGRRALKEKPPRSSTPEEALPAVAEHVDAAFYHGLNTDIGPEVDAANHYVRHGWREGRDPAPWFSTRLYLEMNPDVAESGHNPFVHYLAMGRAEGRSIRPPFQRWTETALKPDSLPPLPQYEPTDDTLAGDAVARQIMAAADVGTSLLVSICECAPDDATGSAREVIDAERRAVRESERPSLRAYPEVPRAGFAGPDEDPVLRLSLGDAPIGAAPTSALVEALLAVRYVRQIDVVIHGLAGHSPERLLAYVGLGGGTRTLWVHDYWLACPCRRLINPDGRISPPVGAQRPHTCRHDRARPNHVRRAQAFLTKSRVTLMAASRAARQGGRRLPLADPQAIRVVEPLPAPTPPARSAPTGPVRVAFLAEPMADCGWPVFQEAARRHSFDGRYQFVAVGERAALPHFITAAPLAPGADFAALTAAIAASSADVVLAIPGWPVPLSRTAHAAVAAGCAILSLEGAGDAADTAARSAHHLVLSSDEAILEAFASGAVRDLATRLGTAAPETVD